MNWITKVSDIKQLLTCDMCHKYSNTKVFIYSAKNFFPEHAQDLRVCQKCAIREEYGTKGKSNNRYKRDFENGLL